MVNTKFSKRLGVFAAVIGGGFMYLYRKKTRNSSPISDTPLPSVNTHSPPPINNSNNTDGEKKKVILVVKPSPVQKEMGKQNQFHRDIIDREKQYAMDVEHYYLEKISSILRHQHQLIDVEKKRLQKIADEMHAKKMERLIELEKETQKLYKDYLVLKPLYDQKSNLLKIYHRILKVEQSLIDGKSCKNEIFIAQNLSKSDESLHRLIAQVSNNYQGGVLAPNMLKSWYISAVEKSVYQAFLCGNSLSILYQSIAHAFSKLMTHSTVYIEGDEPHHITSRIGYHLENNNLRQARDELSSVKNSQVKSVSSDWLQETDKYLSVIKSIERTKDYIESKMDLI